MAGIRKLRKIQIGVESSTDPGTEVNATTYLRLNGTLEDARETIHPDEDVGILWGTDRSYNSKEQGILQTQGEATFEQLPYILNAGVKGVAGVQDGAGTGYVYTYAFPLTDSDTIYSYTIEGGDNQGAEVMTYGIVPEFTLSGEIGQAWMVDATWNGRTVAASTYTAGLSLPSVEEMLFTKTKLYIDNDSDTIGTTQITSTLINANLAVSLWRPVWTADGNLYFAFTKVSQPSAVLTMTFEHNSSAITEKGLWRTNTNRLVRLKAEGTALGTSGTYTYKTLIINLAGSYSKWDKIDEVDGNDVIACTFEVGYNSTYGAAGSIVVVNELSALP
jgi:hypothetical protein